MTQSKKIRGVFDSSKEESIKKILSSLLEENASLLTVKETEVLRMILVENKKPEEAGKELLLTSRRIKDLFHFGVKRLANKLSTLHGRLNHAEQMQEEINTLKSKLKQYEEKEKQVVVLPVETQKLLSMNLEDVALPKRVFNILYAYDFRTVEDLVRISKNDFRKFRNAGKQSADELEAFLKSKGLTWSMKV